MTVLRDHETERVLISSLLDAPGETLRRVLIDEGLRPEHFAVETHGQAFDALVAITDRGDHLDRLTFTAALEQIGLPEPKRLADELFSGLPEIVGVPTYARRIRDLHRRRQLKLAAEILSDAADRGDPDRLAEAEQLLMAPADTEPSTWSGVQLAQRYTDRLGQEAPESYSWPFEPLDSWTGGGLRRQQVVLIGGWTSNGKSVLYDQILDKLAAQGLTCHSYINEMSEEERAHRTVARLSGVPFSKIYRGNLEKDDSSKVLGSLTQMKVGLTECAGWTAPEIARHIRWNRWDVAGVDILHEIAHREERDLAEIAQTLRSAAKQTGCILIACVHLNDNRVTSPQRPVPVLRDVRGSGMLVRGADVVLLVHRDDDKDGVPQDQGVLLAAKIRNGQPNAMGVVFRGEQMRFLPRAREDELWAA